MCLLVKRLWFLLFFTTIYNINKTFPPYMLPQKVVICGVCKNVGHRLPYTINIIEKIGKLFSDYRILVYENNSTDNTKEILKNWKKNNPNLFFIAENINIETLEKQIINRKCDGTLFHPELIAKARNRLLDIVMSKTYKPFPYVIWIDMDFQLEPDYEGIIEVFKTDREWDAIFAYGVDPDGIFWDWYALRDKIDPIGPELAGCNNWGKWCAQKKRSFNQNDDWYPVYSAFGGCGIYKKSSIKKCRYSGIVTKDLAILAKNIIASERSNLAIQKYIKDKEQLTSLIHLNPSSQFHQAIQEFQTGIILHEDDSLVWRMGPFSYQYPSTCEHVTLHASMIVNGHNKLFINPRLVFRYG